VQPLGSAAAFLSSVTWAIGTTFYSRLAKEHSPLVVNFTRALIALPFFLVLAFLSAGGFAAGVAEFTQLDRAHWGWLALSMMASYGLGDSFFYLSTRSLGVPGALAIASAYPLWTTVGGVLLQGQKVSVPQFAGLVLTLGGMILVILNQPRMGATSAARDASLIVPPFEDQFVGLRHSRQDPLLSRRGMGVCLALLTSLFWATNSYSVARGGAGVPTGVANTIRMVFALVLTTVLGALLGRMGLSQRKPVERILPWPLIKTYAWVFACEAFGGSFLFMYGLSHSSMAIGSTLSALAPVIAVPVAWVTGAEKVSFARTGGVVGVVIGLWLLLAFPG